MQQHESPGLDENAVSAAELSRRRFGKSAIAAALSAVSSPSASLRDADPQESEQQDIGLTPVQKSEVDARWNEAIRRYGDRLSEQQRARLRRILVQNERMLAPIREFALANGDAPAATLKLVANGSGREEHSHAHAE